MFIYGESIKDIIIGFYEKTYGIKASEEFLLCAEEQLKKDFERKTGLKVTQRVSIAMSVPPGARLIKGRYLISTKRSLSTTTGTPRG
jgi:hypothetical protein